MISPGWQFKASQNFSIVSVRILSPFFILANIVRLTPEDATKSFWFISKSINNFHSFLYDILILIKSEKLDKKLIIHQKSKKLLTLCRIKVNNNVHKGNSFVPKAHN